jgi:hypothetical protein
LAPPATPPGTTPPAKPTLQQIHDRLQKAAAYLLETQARAAAVGSPTVLLSVQTLADLGKSVVQSMMDLEANLQ